MKKNILIIAAFSTTFAHAMETCSLREITKNSLSMQCNGTTINVTKESVSSAADKVIIIVLGMHQQNMFLNDCHFQKAIGSTFNKNLHDHGIYEDDNDASDDDTYQFYPLSVNELNRRIAYSKGELYDPSGKQEIWKNGNKKNTKIRSLYIAEPCISQLDYSNTKEKSIKIFTYILNKKPQHGSFYRPLPLQFFGDEAIQEASNDLVFCYKRILAKGLGTLELTPQKSIAIPTLSADTGFPRELAAPIAVTTVLEFIKSEPKKWNPINNKPVQYDTINFVVNKRSDIALYKKLLVQRCNGVYNICLLSWAHKDSELLSCLPREIIDYIGLLMLG
jgi:hypothetical protein